MGFPEALPRPLQQFSFSLSPIPSARSRCRFSCAIFSLERHETWKSSLLRHLFFFRFAHRLPRHKKTVGSKKKSLSILPYLKILALGQSICFRYQFNSLRRPNFGWLFGLWQVLVSMSFIKKMQFHTLWGVALRCENFTFFLPCYFNRKQAKNLEHPGKARREPSILSSHGSGQSLERTNFFTCATRLQGTVQILLQTTVLIVVQKRTRFCRSHVNERRICTSFCQFKNWPGPV